MRSSLLWRLAWRNLGRNRRRTLITGGAIVAGVSLCIAVGGLTDGLSADVINSVTRKSLGEIQIHRPGYLAKRALSLTMDDPEKIVRAAEEQPGVSAAAERLYGWGLVGNGKRALGVQLLGVDPRAEARVTTTPLGGLPSEPTPWPERHALTAEEQALDQRLTDEARDAALAEIDRHGRCRRSSGARPARWSKSWRRSPRHRCRCSSGTGSPSGSSARAGDTLSLTAQRADGGTTDVRVRVVGLVRTGNEEIDRSRMVLHLADLQHLLQLEGRVHEIALRVEARDRAGEIAHALGARLPSLSVQSWDELRPDVVAMVRANGTLTSLIVLSVFALAGLGVVNTMLMAVFDRRRELGVLGALGLRPWNVLSLVALETILLRVGRRARRAGRRGRPRSVSRARRVERRASSAASRSPAWGCSRCCTPPSARAACSSRSRSW